MIATSESGLSVLEVVAIDKDLSDVERGFRQLKDSRRPCQAPHLARGVRRRNDN